MSDAKPIKTTCPYCGVGCGVLATYQKDGSLDIAGDPDHPANFGRLCSKGSALGDTISLDGRLLEPKINHESANWEKALDLIADKFRETISEHGPDSVAFYVSGQILTEDYYIANKLMKGYIGSANIDTNSRLCMASSVAGHKRAFGSDTVPGTYEDLERADLLILVGSNLAWCHPVIYQRVVAAKQARPGMKVVLIDPRKTMTADIADLHLPIHADGDAALFCGLLKHLSDNDMVQQSFVTQHTNGFEAARDIAMDYDIQRVAELTGVDADDIAQFYHMFAMTQKTVTVYSQGVNQSSVGSDKVNAIINCHLATGRIGSEGMGPFSVTGQPNAMGGREVGGLANMLAAHMNIEDEAHRALVQTFWGSPKIADKAGLKAVDMFDAVKDGRIKAIWIMATNPVDSMPNADEVRQALLDCPFVVVSDVLEKTDTALCADVLLPSMAWGEKDGTVTNSERRISHQKRILPLPEQVRADWWQMAQVGQRMGFEEAFSYSHASEIFAEFAALSGTDNNGSRDFDISHFDAITPQEFDDLQPFQWPRTKGSKPQETRFFANGNFYTPDRKARFVPVKTGTHAKVPVNGKLLLNTGRVRDHWHTMTRTGKAARLSSHIGEPYCEVSPEDAGALNLAPASLVKLVSGDHEIVVRTLITERQKKGSVFVPMHWTDQFASNGRVDKLVTPRTDPTSGQPALKSMLVTAEPYGAELYGLMLLRDKPTLDNGENYWSLAPIDGGWKLEFALLKAAHLESFVLSIAHQNLIAADIGYSDSLSNAARYVWFNHNQLNAVLYTDSIPVGVSRSWLADQFNTQFDKLDLRFQISAGRPSGDVPDKGPIVCSCFNVGANEINAAIMSGCGSADAVGKATNAGTNCGSCRAEINGLINEQTIVAAE